MPRRALEKLGALLDAHPEWRIGQAIENAIRAAPGRPPLFYASDEAIEEGLDAELARISNAIHHAKEGP